MNTAEPIFSQMWIVHIWKKKSPATVAPGIVAWCVEFRGVAILAGCHASADHSWTSWEFHEMHEERND